MKKLFILLLAVTGSGLQASTARILNSTAYTVQVETMYRSDLCKPLTTTITPRLTGHAVRHACNLIGIRAFVIVNGERYGTAASGRDKDPRANNFYFGPLGSPRLQVFEVSGSLETGFRLQQK